MIAEVIVDLVHAEVDKIFDYSFTDCRITYGSRVIVPFGKTVIEGIVIGVKDKSNYDNSKIKSVYRLLEETPALTPETLELAKFVAKSCYVSLAGALRLFLPAEMRKGKVKPSVIKVADITSENTAHKILAGLKSNAINQINAIKFLLENGKTKLSELNQAFSNGAIKSLVKKGAIIISEEKNFRTPYKSLELESKSVTLTPAQAQAVESIENTDKLVSLIFGVTGSGKTEIYLDLIKRAISNGKTAIMLVPEISLTPQMFKQLKSKFGASCAILHSGLSSGERFDEWWRLRNGEAKIAIGARSAIFAPLENLGLIIIDEEHDGSYVSESSPRYATVEVAKFRAEKAGAKIVLGSATPCIESYLKAEKGEYNLITLTERINKKPLPSVEIVDMRKEVRRGNSSPLSQALKSELEDCINSGNQAMIFLNQRGYSKTVICTECGHVQTCTECDVSLTYHKEDNSLLCHYCGAKYKMIEACTECGSPYIRLGGYGTEKIVAELNKLFPTAKVLRMDRDTTQNKESHFNILNEFSQKKADILVGTQMIAKGHDFPSVTLVGILDADMSLHFSDYRSAERTFSLITQVAGRSGRAERAGKVVLQTYQPDNGTLLSAINYDYLGFYNQEISIRKATAFPPFVKIIRVLISGANEEEALAVTKNVYTELNQIYLANKQDFRFFGCMKAPIKRLQGKFRYQVLYRVIPERLDVIDLTDKIAKKYNAKSVSVYLEINPNNLT